MKQDKFYKPVFERQKKLDQALTSATEIQKEFGLLPKLGFSDGIKNTYNFYKDNDILHN